MQKNSSSYIIISFCNVLNPLYKNLANEQSLWLLFCLEKTTFKRLGVYFTHAGKNIYHMKSVGGRRYINVSLKGVIRLGKKGNLTHGTRLKNGKN